MTEDKRCPTCGTEWDHGWGIQAGTNQKIARCLCGLTMPLQNRNSRPIENELLARIDQLEHERDEWKADAERLANICYSVDELLDIYECCGCGKAVSGHDYHNVPHTPDCPITLHRLLVKKETK